MKYILNGIHFDKFWSLLLCFKILLDKFAFDYLLSEGICILSSSLNRNIM